MLYRPLLFSVKPQHESAQIYVYPLPSEPPSHLSSYPTPLGWYSTISVYNSPFHSCSSWYPTASAHVFFLDSFRLVFMSLALLIIFFFLITASCFLFLTSSFLKDCSSVCIPCCALHVDTQLMVKSLPAVRKTWVQSLCREDPPEEEMATCSSILAWRIPWMEEPSRLQSMGSQRVGHGWMTSLSLSFTQLIIATDLKALSCSIHSPERMLISGSCILKFASNVFSILSLIPYHPFWRVTSHVPIGTALLILLLERSPPDPE